MSFRAQILTCFTSFYYIHPRTIICIWKLLWNDMYMLQDVVVILYFMIWYVEDMFRICYVMIYDMCTIWIVMSESMKMLWFDLYVIWMICYDWHAKRRTSMKYNPGICMRVMINYMINVMRNSMKSDMIWIRC